MSQTENWECNFIVPIEKFSVKKISVVCACMEIMHKINVGKKCSVSVTTRT